MCGENLLSIVGKENVINRVSARFDDGWIVFLSLIGPMEVMKNLQENIFPVDTDLEKDFEVAVARTAEQLAIFYIFKNIRNLDDYLNKKAEASEFHELLSSQFKKFRNKSGLFLLIYEDPETENYVLSVSDDKKVMVDLLSQLLT